MTNIIDMPNIDNTINKAVEIVVAEMDAMFLRDFIGPRLPRPPQRPPPPHRPLALPSSPVQRDAGHQIYPPISPSRSCAPRSAANTTARVCYMCRDRAGAPARCTGGLAHQRRHKPPR